MHEFPHLDSMYGGGEMGGEEEVKYDDDLGDVEWFSEDDEWYSEDEDRYDFIS